MRLIRKRNPDTVTTAQSAHESAPTGRTRSRRELLAEAGGAAVRYGSAAVIGNMIGNLDDAENEEAVIQAHEAASRRVLERRGVDQVAADRLVDYTFAVMGDRSTAIPATRFKGEIVMRGAKGTTRIPAPLVLVGPAEQDITTDPREVPMAYQVTTDQNQVKIKALIGEVEGVQYQPYDVSDPNPFESGMLYGDLIDVDPSDPVGGGKGRRVAVFETPSGKLIQPGVPNIQLG